jgi:hypothetical protein
MEMRAFQKNYLFRLLKLKRDTGDTKELQELIIEVKTSMEAEDVAYVEKMIAELP